MNLRKTSFGGEDAPTRRVTVASPVLRELMLIEGDPDFERASRGGPPRRTPPTNPPSGNSSSGSAPVTRHYSGT